jgi:hypothetical protein
MFIGSSSSRRHSWLAAAACGVLLIGASLNGASGYPAGPGGGPGPSGPSGHGPSLAPTPEAEECVGARCAPEHPKKPPHIATRHNCRWQADQKGLTGAARSRFMYLCAQKTPM